MRKVSTKRGGDDVQADPVQRGELVVHEVRADEQLVQEGEGDGEVGIEVEAVPGFVREPAPGCPDGADADEDEQPEPGRRPQHVRIGRQEHRELVDDARAIAHRVAGRREDAVGADQPDRREPEPTMRHGEAVHAEGFVEPRAAAHEHELDQREVGAEERRELAGGGQRAGRRPELVEAAVADPQQDDEHAVPDEQRHDVRLPDPPAPRQRHGHRTGAGLDGHRRCPRSKKIAALSVGRSPPGAPRRDPDNRGSLRGP